MGIRAGLWILAVTWLTVFSGQASANTFYIGTWKYSGCVLHLKGSNALGDYAAETNFCSGDWAFVTGWRPTNNGVQLLTILEKSAATLTLANGDLVVTLNSGERIAFKRTTPPPAGRAPPTSAGGGSIPVYQPHPFVKGISCVWRGGGTSCATAYDLGLPQHLPRNSTNYTKSVNVTVFTGLNFRAKIGYDQPIHFQIPPGTCVPIWACFDTKDTGPWCVTRLNGKQGYIAKFSLRQSGGDMQVNFGNGCSG